jgi:hypothetical protein
MIAHIYPSMLQAVSGRGYAGCLEGCFQGCRGEAMQDLGYELPRNHILGTWVNNAWALLGACPLDTFHHLLPLGGELIEFGFRSAEVDGHRLALHVL